jgi:ribonuclease I
MPYESQIQQSNYFSKAIGLRKAIDFWKLIKPKLKPDNSISKEELLKTITFEGITPEIECFQNSILNINFCVNNKWNPIACPTKEGKETCPSSIKIPNSL